MKKIPICILIISLVLASCKTNSKPDSNIIKDAVQDYALFFSKSEKDALTQKIIDYEKVSTNEICVYTMDSIPNKNTAQYHATKIANGLGVGKKEKDNGLLILISRHDKQIAIATGFGTEKIITDYMCKEIIDSTIIPKFKQGDYYKGLNNALDSIITIWK